MSPPDRPPAAGHPGEVPNALESPVTSSPARRPRRARPRAAVAACISLAVAVAAVGCGGDESSDAAPAAAVPPAQLQQVAAPAQPAGLGDPVRPGPDTPKKVAKALTETTDVVVIAFVLDGVADDERVAAAVRAAKRGGPSARGATYFTFRIGPKTASFGDLPDILDVDGTPSVAVIARDRTLSNLFTGLVDAAIVRQAVATAKEAPPVALTPARAGVGAGATSDGDGLTGNAKGVAMLRKVVAAYDDVPGIEVTGTVAVAGQGPTTLRYVQRIEDGVPTEGHAAIEVRDVALDAVSRGGTTAIRFGGEGQCWLDEATAGQAGLPGAGVQTASLPQAGKVGAIRREGGTIVLALKADDAVLVYRVDAATKRIESVSAGGRRLAVRALDEPPAIPGTEPSCGSLEDALSGVAGKLTP